MHGFLSKLARKRIGSFYRTWKWLDDSSKVHWYLLWERFRVCWFRFRLELMIHWLPELTSLRTGRSEFVRYFQKYVWPGQVREFHILLGSGPVSFKIFKIDGSWSVPIQVFYLILIPVGFDLVCPHFNLFDPKERICISMFLWQSNSNEKASSKSMRPCLYWRHQSAWDFKRILMANHWLVNRDIQ